MTQTSSHHSHPSLLVTVEWLPRIQPLAPLWVAAWGIAGEALAQRLVTRGTTGGTIEGLTGVVADDLIVAGGPEDQLPWVDGAVYLGSDSTAPLLLMPTTLAPSVPADIVAHAMAAHFGEELLAVLPGIGRVVPLGNASLMALDLLAAWIEECRDFRSALDAGKNPESEV